MSRKKNLDKARNEKNDEFYTRLQDVEAWEGCWLGDLHTNKVLFKINEHLQVVSPLYTIPPNADVEEIGRYLADMAGINLDAIWRIQQ